jgi:hypothetical protein
VFSTEYVLFYFAKTAGRGIIISLVYSTHAFSHTSLYFAVGKDDVKEIFCVLRKYSVF